MTLLAAYNFDEASGNVLDVTGNGHGFAMNASVTRQTGHTSTGLRHETTAADGAGPTIFGQTAQRTLMCWVKRTSNAVDGWILEMKDGTVSSGVWGFLFSGANVQARTKNPGTTVFTVSAAQPTVNTWYHIAMTFDGTKIHLYFDGVEQGTGTTVTGGVLHSGATIFPFMDTVSSETIIDDVRIYDTALSAAQILADRNTPVTGATTNSGTLVGSFAVPVASMTGAAKATGSVVGTFSSPAVAVTGASKASGSVVASFSSPVVAVAGSGKASGSVAASFSSPVVAASGVGRVNAVLAASFSSPVVSMTGDGTDPATEVTLEGTFAAPTVTFSALAKASGSMIGTFAAPAFSAVGGTPLVNRDILVTIGPGERPATSIAAGPARTRVLAGDFKRTEIGA